jgi:hypothetical protein
LLRHIRAAPEQESEQSAVIPEAQRCSYSMDANRNWVLLWLRIAIGRYGWATGMIVAGILGAALSMWMLQDQQSRRKIEATFGLQSQVKH